MEHPLTRIAREATLRDMAARLTLAADESARHAARAPERPYTDADEAHAVDALNSALRRPYPPLRLIP